MTNFKSYFLFSLVILYSQLNQASFFECHTSLNLKVISTAKVSSKFNLKVPVDVTDFANSFVTEKENNFFILEAYLPNHQVRIYSEAHLPQSQGVIRTVLWARDGIIEVSCQNK